MCIRDSANTKEKSTITFNVTSMDCKIKNDINIESGIATPTKIALRNPKKKSKTPTTNRIPKMIEFSKLETMSFVL